MFFKLSNLAALAAVYGLGIVIRPVGAFIFGNIAGQRGRKNAMVYALLLMDLNTLLIGLTPAYDRIGASMTILLILLCLLSGSLPALPSPSLAS